MDAKRILDVIGACLGLFLFAPLITAIGISIGVAMGWPILFLQSRPGLHGRPFTLLKFRTMIDKSDHLERGQDDALRLTRLGRTLRAMSLDELPEFWNVLRGDMSLVGPRPLLMQYLPRYTKEQARRHEVKPGLTGWAQINGRNAISWEEKFNLDTWYVDNQSLWLDIKVICITVKKVLLREGVNHAGEATMSEFMGTGAE